MTFFCPACSARLTVPASLAGVAGPCPTCHTVIQAPIPVHPPQATPQQPAPPAYYAPQANPSLPEQPVTLPSPSQQVRTVQPRTHITAPDPSSNIMRLDLRGPRHVPIEPESHPEVIARPISDIPHRGQTEYRPHPPLRSPRSYGFRRVLISLGVIAVMAGVAYGLVTYLRGSIDAPGNSKVTKSLEILPKTEIPKPADLPPPRSVIKSPANPPANPSTAIAPPKKIHAGAAAMKVLEKFLSANTLAERLPLIESSLSEADLAQTALAGPLPSDPRVAPDIQETNRAENFTDLYYNLDFKKPDGKFAPYVILLRARGEEQPKVIVDPFLDTYGGRISAFASTPSDNPGTFQVVVTAVAKTTSDQKVPNHEQKLWLKLLPRDNEKEIASAYFRKNSKIGQMLANDSSGFRYGQAKPARITLQWNLKEDPQMPYLEVIDIKDFRWNP